MTRESLIESASAITPPSQATSQSLTGLADAMASELSRRMLEKDNLEELIGKDNQSLMVMNHENHFNYISTLASLYDPVSFVETVIWVFRTYIARGFSPS